MQGRKGAGPDTRRDRAAEQIDTRFLCQLGNSERWRMLKKARRSRTSEEMQCRHAEWFQRTLAYRIIYGFSFLCQLFVIEGGQNCPHATLIAQKEKTSIVTTTWRHPNIPENVPPKINNSLENYEYLQEGHMSFLSTCCLLRISQ